MSDWRRLTREEIAQVAIQEAQRYLHRIEDAAMLGAPAVRTFVCQGCGQARAVLHGNRLTCGCGATSAAEVLS